MGLQEETGSSLCNRTEEQAIAAIKKLATREGNTMVAGVQLHNTVEPLIADTPFKRTPNSGPNRFFYKILVI